jgi:hypothetical protein
MKFSAIFIAFGLAAFTIAADTTGTETSTSAAPSVSLTATDICLAKCASGDVTCQAQCEGVPSPNADAANATTECAAKCVQGDGTASATQEYSDCVQACIKTNFYTSTTGGAAEATTAASGSTGTGSGSATGASGTNTGNSQSTGTATQGSSSTTTAKTSATGNSAPIMVTGGSFLSLFAMVAGILVL